MQCDSLVDQWVFREGLGLLFNGNATEASAEPPLEPDACPALCV